MLDSYSSLSTKMTVKDSELRDLAQHVLQHDTMIETLVAGKHLSSALSSCSSGNHDAMAIAAIRSAENLAVTVAHAQGAAALATSEVHTMKRIVDLFETDLNDTTAKQSEQETVITELRQQLFSLTDSHMSLMRRVAEMERNVRPRMGEAPPSQSFQDGRLGDLNGLPPEEEPPTGQPRRVLPSTFGGLGLRGGGQLFIKTLAGKTITIDDMNDSDSVETLKTMIRLKLHWIFTQNADFYLIFHGMRLMNEATLAQYHITPGATVWMVLRLRGGMDAGPTFARTKNTDFL